MIRRFDNFAARIEGKAGEGAAPEPPPLDETAPQQPASAAAPANPEASEQKEPETMTTETPLEEREDYIAGHAAGEKKAADRMNAVFAHENAKGREAHAVRLLGRSMSADEICDELAHLPAVQQVSQEQANAAAEEAAREEMQSEMAKSGNADLGADENNDGKTGRAAADAVWDKANAHVGRVKKEG